MLSTTEKTAKTSHIATKQVNGATFFRKAEDPSFFGSHDKPAFFSAAAIQPKLSVSTPDDPHEKEADRVADQVMRMPDPVAAAAPVETGGQPGEELQRKEDEEKEIHPKLETPQITALQCKLQRRAIQPVAMAVQRSADDDSVMDSGDAMSSGHSEGIVLPKIMPLCRSPGMQMTNRGPPATTSNFESALSSSKGNGSALPSSTMETMNSRFGADFSNVRIHTGSAAESLSSSISAQAFTHGSDIYFNAGKFQPGTEGGSLLLAHELTHTIQQGSVAQPSRGSAVSRKPIIQRQAHDRPVPSQLNNAVAKAKGEVGKVNANEAGPDGFRTGWQRLVEYFKTTLGEDKVVAEGQAGTKGSISEGDIKKKRDVNAMPPANPRPAAGPYSRDAMPSWCGIFAFWALHKGGVPMNKWIIGGPPAVDLKAAYPPGYIPKAGDIAYRNAFSHYALVEKASGDTVTTVNGNTSGENNLGAQIQVKDHPLKTWTAFFDPLMMMTGQLGSGDAPAVEEKPKTLRELRQELFHVNRKEEQEASEHETTESQPEAHVQTKPELSTWGVNADGALTNNQAHAPPVQAKEEPGHQEEEQNRDEGQHELPAHELQRKADGDEAGEGTGEAVDVPQVQLRVDKKGIQRHWYDSALDLIDSAVDLVEDGLEAGKRLLLGKARDFAMNIPGYKALRVILGEDPITSEHVDQNGHNFIEAAFDIMPFGQMLHDKLEELGALTEAEAWVDNQIKNFVSMVHGIEGDIETFWNSLSLSDLGHPVAVFERIGALISNTIMRVVTFAETAGGELLSIVKKFLLSQLASFVRDHTTAYPLLTVILNEDPITGQRVERNGTTILNALLELGGDTGREQRRQMQETGSFQKVANYIDQGIAIFSNAYRQIKDGIASIWDYVSITSLMHPIDTFNRIYDTFAPPIRQVWDFVSEVGAAILRFIKEVLMVRLSNWARGQRGYFLVTVIIGRDPFTGASVPRNVENIIHGFMSLMEGGEEQFNQMKQSGAIDRTTQRINAAVDRLNMTPASIIQLFIDLWHSFSLNDLIHPIAAFERIIHTFGAPIMRLIAFVIEIIKIIIEVIMQIMNFPIDLINNIIVKAMQAIDMIKRDPIGFLKNLLKAIKQGFVQFFNNIVNHLIFGLTGWLMSELKDAGVPELTDTSLRGVITWILAVLDLSMETIWRKLAEHPRIGPERVARIRGMINTLEGIWTFIKDVQERGIAAIWDKIQEQLNNLWDTVLTSVKNWVMDQIVSKVTAKLLSMLDPTGIMAVINSAIALYNAIKSFIKYLREMLQVVNSFVEGVVEIASGNTQKAADFLEGALHRAMPIVIGFLADQVGLGGIGHRIGELIGQAREMVDQAITWLVNKAVELGGRLLEMGRSAVAAVLNWWQNRVEFSLPNGERHEVAVEGSEDGPIIKVASEPMDMLVLIAHRRASPTALTPQQTAALQAAETKNTDLVNYIRTNKTIADAGGSPADAIKAEILNRLNLIKADLIAGDALNAAEAALPVTPVPTYGGVVNGFGSRMDVKPLTKLGTTGSSVNASNPDYTDLLFRKRVAGGSNTYYVAGHLLNNNVHGDGSTWQNLTPIANTTNQDHEDKVESKVKEAAEKNLILHYTVEVEYGMSVKDNLLQEIVNLDPNWATNSILSKKHKIITAEGKLPKKLHCTVKQVKADGTDLNAGEPGYDAKYNISGAAGEIDNESRVAQSDLGVYNLQDAAATTYRLYPALEVEANTALQSNPALPWNNFYNDPNNKQSIDNLATTPVPDGKAKLRAIFAKKELFFEEKTRVEGIAPGVTPIQTWTAFKGARAAYQPNAIDPVDMGLLESKFRTNMGLVKDALLNRAKTDANQLAAVTAAWGVFKADHDLYVRAGVLEQTDIDDIKDNYFDKRITALRNAPAVTGGAAPPPTP